MSLKLIWLLLHFLVRTRIAPTRAERRSPSNPWIDRRAVTCCVHSLPPRPVRRGCCISPARMPATRLVRRRQLRLMGYALIANGALGLLLVAVALVALGPLLTRASLAVDSAGDSLSAAAEALDQTAT